MSKSLRIIIGVLLFISTISFAHSGDKFYLKTGVSLNKVLSENISANYMYDGEYESYKVKLKSKNYRSYSLGVGYKITSFYNIEGLFQYAPNFYIKGTFYEDGIKDENVELGLKHYSLIVNNIFSIPELINEKWPVKPYFGLGLGVVRYDTKDNIGDGTNFLYKATLGTVFPITKSIDLDLSYAYGDYGKIKLNGKDVKPWSPYNFKAHEVFLGLRYKF